jgi:hypothetical protein
MFRPFVFMAALVVGTVSPIEPPNLLPALDHAARRFSEASLAFIERSFTPVRAETEPVDAKAAANLDEDLDWRIASQDKTIATWLAFLDKHPHGAHARDAQAELDKLTGANPPPPQTPTFAPVVEVANAQPHEPDVFAALEQRQPPPERRIVEVETTVVKWREPRTRYVTRWRYERPRYSRRPASPPPFFLSLFGPRDPRAWHGH